MKIIKLNFKLHIKEFMNEKDRFLNFVWILNYLICEYS